MRQHFKMQSLVWSYRQFCPLIRRCRVATHVRGEGRDHGGLGLRSRGEGIGHGMEALLKKKKNEQEIKSNKRNMETR